MSAPSSPTWSPRPFDSTKTEGSDPYVSKKTVRTDTPTETPSKRTKTVHEPGVIHTHIKNMSTCWEKENPKDWAMMKKSHPTEESFHADRKNIIASLIAGMSEERKAAHKIKGESRHVVDVSARGYMKRLLIKLFPDSKHATKKPPVPKPTPVPATKKTPETTLSNFHKGKFETMITVEQINDNANEKDLYSNNHILANNETIKFRKYVEKFYWKSIDNNNMRELLKKNNLLHLLPESGCYFNNNTFLG